MNQSRHVMILASAGSGKTYALTNRFVALLAQGAAPDRIVALTFTRKAAGEFFDEILNKLARAAGEEAYARIIASAIDHPQLRPADFLQMLRAVTEVMHRLRLGTLDGFFARIARTFPLELGLAGEFEILEEHAARFERQRVLRRMFARSGELAAAQKEFVEAFKRATYGLEEKRLGARLDAFLDEHQENFLAAPEADLWGNQERIWPRGNSWLERHVDLTGALADLRDWLNRAALDSKHRRRWDDFLVEVEAWSAGMDPAGELTYVLDKALDVWSDLEVGRGFLSFDRKRQELDGRAARALAEIARHVVRTELMRRLATTRGIHAVLRGYEAVYHDAVRRAGKLTFGDVQRLLVPEGGAPTLTQQAGESGVLSINFRLDGEIDHWLLDEFQDTSFGQWRVLQNLIDEAIQDPTGGRTFFCVGDVKQAIFTWREGDPRLFREIFNHYNAAAPGTISEGHLVASYRSGPPLIAMVNAVFGRKDVLTRLFDGPASESWNGEWREHRSAVPTRTGQAALLHGVEEADRWAAALKVIEEIRPLERGLTCAVLVPQNDTAAEFADYLRRVGGLPALAESDLHVGADNPLGSALLALVQAAAHPGDRLAWEHVRMTPFGRALVEEGLGTADALTAHLLGQVHAHGFERALEFWLIKIAPRIEGDSFTQERARQFMAAAGLFDETGSRDFAEFIQFMERQTVRDAESATVIRVMTIHKSKGLGFDVVILPELEGKRIDEARKGLAVARTSDRVVEWVLDLPPKLFWRNDQVLAAYIRAAEAEACYEALSLLYVAMTRAKRAMYVITKPVGRSSSRNYPRLLADTLGADSAPIKIGELTLAGAWSVGEANWHRHLPPRPAAPPPARSKRVIEETTTRRASRRATLQPSAEKKGLVSAAQILALDSDAGALFGTQVHALLAEVDWSDPWSLAEREAEWRRQEWPGEALKEVLAVLRTPALTSIWAEPGGPSENWRERAFEVVLDDIWVTGIFDRVVVERDAAQRPIRVRVFDFKTDRVTEASNLATVVNRYAAQLNLYRRVAAKLTGLNPAAISCELVLTRSRQRVAVPVGPP